MGQFHEFTAFSETAGFLKEAQTATSNGHVFRGVTIIKSGLGNKRDKHFYTPKAMREGVDKGIFNDLRAFVDHPTTSQEKDQPERSVKNFAGVYVNPRFIEGNGNGQARIVADLHILPGHQKLAEDISALVGLGLGDRIGISILGSGKTSPTKVKLSETETLDVHQVDQFTAMRSADFVTQAGAGGGFSELLESAREGKETVVMKKSDVLKQIAEAATAGDETKVNELTAQLAEAEADATETPDPAPKADAETKEADAEAADEKADETDEAEETPADETEDEEADVTECSCGKIAEALPGASQKSGQMTTKAGKRKNVGKKFGESDDVAVLKAQIDSLVKENATLQGQAKAATLTAYIDKRVRECKVPKDAKNALRGKLATLTEKAHIDAEVIFAETMAKGIADSALSRFEEVEGAGGGTREGSTSADAGDQLREAASKHGLPMKRAKK